MDEQVSIGSTDRHRKERSDARGKMLGGASGVGSENAIRFSADHFMEKGWSFPADETNSMRVQLSIKRLLDIVCAILLLLMLLPVLIVVAVCVRLSSKGPILYKQERCGWRGSTFVCLKFRSMFGDHKAPIDSQTQRDRQGVLVKVRSDSRVTPMGLWLRRTSIDELPQLLNVLRGEMSMVGPRPLEPYLLEPYPEFRGVRDRVRPGITGLWQISARDPNATAVHMMSHDSEYIRKMSPWLDFKILLKTAAVVLLAKGAR